MSMTNLWPFVVRGIDLIGRLPKGRGSVQYAVVDVDYFTTWVEAEALASIMPTKTRSSFTRTSSIGTESPTPSYLTMEHSLTTTNSRSSTITSRSRRYSHRSSGLRLIDKSKL